MDRNPELDRLSDAEWNRRAEANWRRLDEDGRDYWRGLVRERLPELCRRPGWLEPLAKGWAFDPSMVAGMPPERNAMTDRSFIKES